MSRVKRTSFKCLIWLIAVLFVGGISTAHTIAVADKSIYQTTANQVAAISTNQTISQNATSGSTVTGNDNEDFFADIWNSIKNLFNSNLKLFVFYIIMIVIPLLIILAIFIARKGGIYYYKNDEEGEKRVEVKKQEDNKSTLYVQSGTSKDKNLSRATTSDEIKDIIKSRKVSVVSIEKENPAKALEQLFGDVAEEALKKGYYYKGKGQYKLAVQFLDEYVLFTSDDEKRKMVELEIISCMLAAKKYESAEYRILRLAANGYTFTEQQKNKLNKILEIIGSPRRLK